MPDDLTMYLLTDRSRHARISPETLEMMGKTAANRLLSEGIPLNQGIVELASEHADITPEQVKRVVEFANQATHLGLHEKDKTAGEQSSYPQFELADSTEILAALTTRASPDVQVTTSTDYGREPTKTAAVDSVTASNLLADLFEVKKASAELDYTKDSVVEEIISVKEDLTSLRDHLTHTAGQMDLMWKEAQEDYYDHIRRHLLNGGSFADILAAARIPGVEQEKIGEALKPFVTRLLQDKVASPEKLRAQSAGFNKVAHRIVNEQHPLVTTFRAYLSFNQEIEKVATGLQDVEMELGRVNAFIKERLCGGTAR